MTNPIVDTHSQPVRQAGVFKRTQERVLRAMTPILAAVAWLAVAAGSAHGAGVRGGPRVASPMAGKTG
jgi:hypothetical protein